MTALAIAPADPRAPEVRALIEALTAEMAPYYTAEETFGYPVEALVARGVSFLVARTGAGPVACGGVESCDGYAELKRFYVLPAARGTGAAWALLSALEETARQAGHTRLRLETGRHQAAALRFYRREGFAPCPRFGAYPENATSVYLEKAL